MDTRRGGKSKISFYLERDKMLAETAVILLLLSPVFRLIGCWGLWNDRMFMACQMALPVAACLLLALCVFLLGRRLFWLSCIPVLMGAGFFMVYAFALTGWLRIGVCVLVTALTAAAYICTMFGLIRTKWLLPPAFALIFLYRIGVRDIAAMQDTAHPVSFSAGMLEISILCALAALVCIGLALKKKESAADVELPKIKDPVVLAPQPAAPEESPLTPADTLPAEETVSAPAAEESPVLDTALNAADEQKMDTGDTQ